MENEEDVSYVDVSINGKSWRTENKALVAVILGAVILVPLLCCCAGLWVWV